MLVLIETLWLMEMDLLRSWENSCVRVWISTDGVSRKRLSDMESDGVSTIVAEALLSRENENDADCMVLEFSEDKLMDLLIVIESEDDIVTEAAVLVVELVIDKDCVNEADRDASPDSLCDVVREVDSVWLEVSPWREPVMVTESDNVVVSIAADSDRDEESLIDSEKDVVSVCVCISEDEAETVGVSVEEKLRRESDTDDEGLSERDTVVVQGSVMPVGDSVVVRDFESDKSTDGVTALTELDAVLLELVVLDCESSSDLELV